MHDRTFVWLLALTAVLVAAAYAQICHILPPYVHEHASVSPTGIGVVFFVNTLVLVVAQLPIAKALGGHNRLRALALTGRPLHGHIGGRPRRRPRARRLRGGRGALWA
jgi:hypothetical protein